MSVKISNGKRDDAQAVAPKLDVRGHAHESDRQWTQAGIGVARVSPLASEPRWGTTMPRAAQTGFGGPDPEDDRALFVSSSTVPILVAREEVSEVVTLQPSWLEREAPPGRSSLLVHIDGARDLDAIVQAVGWPRGLVIAMLRDLVRSGVVVLDQRER